MDTPDGMQLLDGFRHVNAIFYLFRMVGMPTRYEQVTTACAGHGVFAMSTQP
jgi:hypothetical protein